MVPALIAKIGIPALAGIVSDALGRIDNPVAKTAAKALDELDDVLSTGGISQEQIEEANRHAEKMAELNMEQYQTALSEVNESLRVEVASDDPYVRRMRPTFGYVMAISWAAQMLGLAWIIVFRTDEASRVLNAIESLSLIWAMGLSVLGIYVFKRSGEKKSAP